MQPNRSAFKSRRGMNKKGISAVVATVLLVMITIAAVGIIWAGVIPLIKNLLEGSVACNDVDVTIGTSQGYTCYDSAQQILIVQAIRDVNNINVSGLKFLVSSSGSSHPYNIDLTFEKGSSMVFYLNTSTLTSVDQLGLVPILTNGKKDKECSKIMLNNIPSCSASAIKLGTGFGEVNPTSILQISTSSGGSSCTPNCLCEVNTYEGDTCRNSCDTGDCPGIKPRPFTATGGTIADVENGLYRVHTFKSSGTFTVTYGSKNVEVLVVAGGGGGGKAEPNRWGDGAGGGGAGGLIYNSSYNVTPGTINVVVGSGGLGSTVNSARGENGANSIFGLLTAIGGGGGGSDNHDLTGINLGANGGSGGGSASMHTNTVPSSFGTLGQGNNGSSSIFSGRKGGGGGGAGSASVVSQNGGVGFSSSINGSSFYYAGGGGGGAGEFTDSFGIGGSSIGGSGGIRDFSGGNAVANTGSGGGGGGTCNAPATCATTLGGGNGSAGIVIVRYLIDV